MSDVSLVYRKIEYKQWELENPYFFINTRGAFKSEATVRLRKAEFNYFG